MGTPKSAGCSCGPSAFTSRPFLPGSARMGYRHSHSQPNSKSSKARRRLFFEHLEDRSLLAVSVTVSDGIVNEPAYGPPTDMLFTVRMSEPRDVVTIFNWFTNPYTATPGDD